MRFISLPNKPALDVVLLAVLLALFFGLSLGQRPYSAPSEARYIEIGREMAASNDFVTPRLNYVKYFEKPPLFYWIQAGATKLWGITPFTARIPTAAFSLLLCLLTYGLGRMLYGRLAGWMSGLALATTLYMFALSRVVLLDVPVSFFIVATLTAFLYVAGAQQSRKRTLILYGIYVAAGGAVLTKGLIGAVLPGVVIVLWLAFTGRWSLLRNLRLCSGIILFLLIAVPWHVLVAARNPEWFHFYFIHEHFERYLTKEHGRYQPFWFFIVVLIAGLFPWIVFIGQALRSGLERFWQSRHADGTSLFLVIWIAFILLFFSLSDSKLIPYILPVFPPLCALTGRYLGAAWQEKSAPGFTWGMWTMILLFCLMALLPSLATQVFDADSKVFIALAQGGDETRNLSVVCMIAAATLLIVYIQGRARHVIITMFAAAFLIAQMADLVAAHYNRDSMETLAGVIRASHKPGDEVVTYQNYYQDLPVYLGRRITVVDWKGELEFGSAHENTTAWMIDGREFWRRWLKGDHLMFAIMRDDAYLSLIKNKKPETLHLYAVRQDGRNVLFVNQSPPTIK